MDYLGSDALITWVEQKVIFFTDIMRTRSLHITEKNEVKQAMLAFKNKWYCTSLWGFIVKDNQENQSITHFSSFQWEMFTIFVSYNN